MEFTSAIIPVPTAAASYFWDFGDGNTAGPLNTLNSVTHTFSDSGFYYVCLSFSDSILNCINTVCDSVDIPNPTCNASFTSQSYGSAFAFFGNTSLPGSAVTYFWDFGDGNSATGINTVNAYANPGFYNVCLQVQDSGLQCLSCDSILVSFDTGLLRISGNVSVNSAGSSGDMVILYETTNTGSAPFIRALDTSILVNGNYTFYGLNPSSYSIRVIPENQSMDPGLIPKYWQASNYWGNANSLLLNASQQGINMNFSNKPLTLSGAGSIVVSVRDNMNQYINGATIWLENMNQQVLKYSESNNGSDIVFDNLPLDNYRVGTDLPGYYMFKEDVSLTNASPRDSIGLKILGNWLTTPLNESYLAGKIKLYPNPAVDHIFINNVYPDAIVRIMDLQGRDVACSVSSDKERIKIIFGVKPKSGIYMVQLITNEISLSKKLQIK